MKIKNRDKSLVRAAQGIQARKVRRNHSKRSKRAVEAVIRPTAERERHNETRSAGMAMRITPPIETMHNRKQITDEEFAILKTYSLAFATANGSEVRSCCDPSVRGGSGHGPSAAVIHAKIVTAQLENRADPHVALIRAVCGNDKTLTQWCIDRFGGRERHRGKAIEIVPKGKDRVGQALTQLKDAANRMARG